MGSLLDGSSWEEGKAVVEDKVEGLTADRSDGWSVGLLADRSDSWLVGLLADRSDGWSVGLLVTILLTNLVNL